VPGAPVELLKQVPIFSDLEHKELERVARSFKERQFRAGQTIAEEGKGGVGFFVIESGTAKVTVRGQERATLGPGSYFGEIALIDDGARTATVTAETDLNCYGLTSWEFRPLVEMNSSIAWKLLQALARMLRQVQQGSS
jgi:CRP-like cAMP-binding protein